MPPVENRVAPAINSGERESEQARAKQGQASCSQGQEAIGDKVMIGHDAPSESMLARID